jgi:hypothetical protein
MQYYQARSDLCRPLSAANVHRHPLALLEVRRILLEHLNQVEGQVKQATE